MSDPAALFGILILDRDPVALQHFLGLFQAWLQIAGGCAAASLGLYLLFAILTGGGDSASNKLRMPITPLMLICFAVCLVGYSAYFVLVLNDIGPHPSVVNEMKVKADPTAFYKQTPPEFSTALQPLTSMCVGCVALLGFGLPFVRDLFKLRVGRIYALTKLAFMEAVRSRVFWALLVALIPFLFPVKWFFPIKAEDELRATVRITTLFMEILLLIMAALITAFSIPNDIKNQNIFTIVSKPVERFEIVLGRFFGYLGLMTFALAAMAGGSLALIWSSKTTGNLDDLAQAETYKARVPARGTLSFLSRKGQGEGTNVGREFDYRKYIGGSPYTSERAVWSFASVPSSLTVGDKGAVPVEFTFDIFRLTKGEENRGVDVNIRLTTWQCPQVPPSVPRDGEWKWAQDAQRAKYTEKAAETLKLADGDEQYRQMVKDKNWDALYPVVQARLGSARPENAAAWQIVNDLAEEFGFFEVTSKQVYDYHPESVPVPTGLFKNARTGSPKAEPDGKTPAAVTVAVKCTSPGQMLGMAEGDLYLLEGNQPFELNYLKAAVGLWCKLAVVIAVAVCLSTYLAGVVTLLATAFLYLCAMAMEHLRDVAMGTNTGGGPFKSLTSLLRAEQPTTQLDRTAPVRAAESADTVTQWVFRQFANILPDVDGFTWTAYLKEGFNVNGEFLFMNVLITVGYVIPWLVLGYYLLRNREVAA